MSDPVKKKIGDLTVTIERDTCISSGNCIKVAPQLLEFDDESIVSFKDDAPEVDRAVVIDACQVCPVEALLVHDESGEQIVP